MGIQIVSTGVYLPEQMMSASSDIETSGGKEIDELFTGGENYRVASELETNTYMGTRAAQQAIDNAGIDPNSIDVALGYSFIPDYAGPRDIYGIIKNLGLNNVMAWTLDVTCASFMSHMHLANLLSHTDKKRILMVESTNWVKRGFGDKPISNAVGDGAGAVIVDVVDGQGSLIDIRESSNASLFDFISMKETVATGEREYITFTKSNRVIHKSISIVAENALALLDKNNLTANDITWSISHQPGVAVIKKWHQIAGIPLEKNLNTYSLYGNVSAANIPITLNHYTQVEPKIKRGDLILMMTAGSGVHPVAGLIKY